MTTVSYRRPSAPQLLTKLLQKLEEEETQLFQMASQLTKKNFYLTNQTDTVNQVLLK
jgi:hypothetical protein